MEKLRENKIDEYKVDTSSISKQLLEEGNKNKVRQENRFKEKYDNPKFDIIPNPKRKSRSPKKDPTRQHALKKQYNGP